MEKLVQLDQTAQQVQRDFWDRQEQLDQMEELVQLV
jgi:hypothetical protein